jgi:hypothetical protein
MSTFDPDSDPSPPDFGASPFGPGPGSGAGSGGAGGGLTGPYGRIPGLPGMRHRFRRRRLGCLGALILVVIVLAVVYTLPNPWALRIGGRFTPTESWQGYGAVAASNGGRYELYLDLRGGLLSSVTSTADAGTASTVIRYGTAGDFQSACQRLAA